MQKNQERESGTRRIGKIARSGTASVLKTAPNTDNSQKKKNRRDGYLSAPVWGSKAAWETVRVALRDVLVRGGNVR